MSGIFSPVLLTIFATALFLLAGCSATTIVPPAHVSVPARVAVLDHGRHSSLLLERPDGSVVRWAYGEWEWYAEGRTGPARALGALFVPSEAALGRKLLPGPLTEAEARGQLREGFERILIFNAEAERAGALDRRLEGLFQAGRDRLLRNPAYDLDFVPLPSSYWLGRNSNHITAEWLEELGCRVEGAGALSDWEVSP